MNNKEVDNKEKQYSSSQESEPRKYYSKNLVVYYLKRVFHYLIILHGIMTIIFFLIYFQGFISQNFIDFYLYFSIFIFIAYGVIILGINFLGRVDFETTPEKSAKEELLQGKTLQIYWYILTHSYAGVREIQKALNISSPGTVSYQINKLVKAGIISKNEDEGKYSINEEVKRGILKLYLRIGYLVIPRISLYLVIYILGFIWYLIIALISGEEFIADPFGLLLLFFLIFGTVILIFESFKIWKLKPLKK